MNNSQTASIIKNICKQKGYSVSSILDACQIRKSLIYDMERRDWTPSAEVLEKIADYLDCSVDYLLDRTDNPEINKTDTAKKIYNLSLAEQGEIAAEGGGLTSTTVKKNNVYERLQKMCKEKDISITSLCLKATGNKGNLSTWKNNNGHMRSDYLSNCADILNCTTDEILGREVQKLKCGINSSTILKTSPHIIAYIDILGTKEKMHKHKHGHLKSFATILNSTSKLCDTKVGVRNDIIKQNPQMETVLNYVKYKVFSDNILLAIEYNPQSSESLFENTRFILALVSSLQQSFIVEASQLSRGGICAGELFMDDMFVYGDGLIKAYELENNIAQYPRVVIDKDLYNLLSSYDFQKVVDLDLIKYDFDDELFIHYFKNYSLEDGLFLKDLISNTIKNNKKNLKVLQKLNWAKKYIDEYVINPNYHRSTIVGEKLATEAKAILEEEIQKNVEDHMDNLSISKIPTAQEALEEMRKREGREYRTDRLDKDGITRIAAFGSSVHEFYDDEDNED